MHYRIMEPHCLHHTYTCYAGITFYSMLFVSVQCVLAKVGLTIVGVFMA